MHRHEYVSGLSVDPGPRRKQAGEQGGEKLDVSRSAATTTCPLVNEGAAVCVVGGGIEGWVCHGEFGEIEVKFTTDRDW